MNPQEETHNQFLISVYQTQTEQALKHEINAFNLRGPGAAKAAASVALSLRVARLLELGDPKEAQGAGKASWLVDAVMVTTSGLKVG